MHSSQFCLGRCKWSCSTNLSKDTVSGKWGTLAVLPEFAHQPPSHAQGSSRASEIFFMFIISYISECPLFGILEAECWVWIIPIIYIGVALLSTSWDLRGCRGCLGQTLDVRNRPLECGLLWTQNSSYAVQTQIVVIPVHISKLCCYSNTSEVFILTTWMRRDSLRQGRLLTISLFWSRFRGSCNLRLNSLFQ